MRENVLEALKYIHENGLSNMEWNIEENEGMSTEIYDTFIYKHLPPHIGIITDIEKYPETPKDDAELWQDETTIICIYYL